MTEQQQLAPTPEAQAAAGGMNVQRMVIIGTAILIGLLLLLFGIALALAAFGGVGFAEVVRTIRDLVIIFLALEGILIIMSLAILTLQIARLVNLLNNEIRPILENTKSAAVTAKGTAEFVGGNVVQPMIRASGFLTGLMVVLRELFGLRRVIRDADKEREHEAS